jgi:hypothetical protein
VSTPPNYSIIQDDMTGGLLVKEDGSIIARAPQSSQSNLNVLIATANAAPDMRAKLLVDVIDRFMENALAAISGAVCTPEKGYAEDGGLNQLLSDIKLLRKQHDAARAILEFVKGCEVSPFVKDKIDAALATEKAG